MMENAAKRLAAYGLQFTNRAVLPVFESMVAPGAALPLRHPVIFIVGAPRSGSTLLMQLLSDAFDVGYLSNGHCRYFGAPALAETLTSPMRGRRASDFRSRHGATALRYEPSECAHWWYRFFPREHGYVRIEDVDPLNMDKMRRSIAALVNAFDRPVLFKNLFASVRLAPIIQHFPEALFIVISRSELENARSILRGRKQRAGSYASWWSVQPANAKSLRSLPPHSQVVEQIRGIYAQIDSDFDDFEVPAERIHRVSYESICENAGRIVADVEIFFSRNAVRVGRLFDTPDSFERRAESRLEPDLDAALLRYIETGE